MTKERIKLRTFDVTNYLDNEEVIEAYLLVVQEENDPEAYAKALIDVARAREKTRRAKEMRP